MEIEVATEVAIEEETIAVPVVAETVTTVASPVISLVTAEHLERIDQDQDLESKISFKFKFL